MKTERHTATRFIVTLRFGIYERPLRKTSAEENPAGYEAVDSLTDAAVFGRYAKAEKFARSIGADAAVREVKLTVEYTHEP